MLFSTHKLIPESSQWWLFLINYNPTWITITLSSGYFQFQTPNISGASNSEGGAAPDWKSSLPGKGGTDSIFRVVQHRQRLAREGAGSSWKNEILVWTKFYYKSTHALSFIHGIFLLIMYLFRTFMRLIMYMILPKYQD